MKSANNSEYRDAAIEQLRESPTNPRRRFNQEGLKELAASFQSQGVLQPLLVATTAGTMTPRQNDLFSMSGRRPVRVPASEPIP